MKKFSCLILIFSLLLLATSCTKNIDKKTTSSASSHVQTEVSTKTVDKNLKTSLINDVGGGTPTLTKYRSIYCDIPRPFVNLVDIYEYQTWYENIIKDDPNETNVMVMKLFIQDFNISREDFDRANLEWTKIIIKGFKGQPVMNPQDFANQEINEVYNADIIYTFDDEVINNYYLSHEYPYLYELEYEQAVANGEYVSQTTDWIDIEQMEAEIIAKYGEAEIVTEIATEPAAAESTQAAIPEETETTE